MTQGTRQQMHPNSSGVTYRTLPFVGKGRLTHLHRKCFRPGHICPGLCSPFHICTGTGAPRYDFRTGSA